MLSHDLGSLNSNRITLCDRSFYAMFLNFKVYSEPWTVEKERKASFQTCWFPGMFSLFDGVSWHKVTVTSLHWVTGTDSVTMAHSSLVSRWQFSTGVCLCWWWQLSMGNSRHSSTGSLTDTFSHTFVGMRWSESLTTFYLESTNICTLQLLDLLIALLSWDMQSLLYFSLHFHLLTIYIFFIKI